MKEIRELLDAVDGLEQMLGIFDYSGDIYLYIKNNQSQILYANSAFIELLGVKSLADLLGKTDKELFEPHIAELYLAEDTSVFGGAEIANKKWMIPDPQRRIHWYVSSKKPLRSCHGEIIGLIGVIRNLSKEDENFKPYNDLNSAITYINQNISRKIDMASAAATIRLSVSQFDRKFKKFFGMTPSQYILKLRLNIVAEQLINTDKSLSEISYQVGMCDQAYMSNQFKKFYAISPLKYRTTHTSK